jgi:hypothetical protein
VRYYKITLTNLATGQPLAIPSLSGSGMPPGVITSLLPDGTINPGALNIEIDAIQNPEHVGDTSSYVRIWGLSLQELSQSFNLNPNPKAGPTTGITLEAGMSKGYPLANPAQQGLLIKGTVLQAFGNWIGVDQTLDIYFGPPAGNQITPANLTFTWANTEPLSAMIARVLKQVFPNAQQEITINASRIGNQDKVGSYQTFTQFAQAVRDFTQNILSPTDPGVFIAYDGQVVKVFEGAPTSSATGIKEIAFTDLLGQVTWAEPQLINAKLVMRGDLNVNDQIKFPQGIVTTTTPQAMSSFGGTSSQNPSNTLTFGNNQFNIQRIQHWGNFRQPDGTAWNTSIWASVVAESSGSGSASLPSAAPTGAGATTPASSGATTPVDSHEEPAPQSTTTPPVDSHDEPPTGLPPPTTPAAPTQQQQNLDILGAG